MESFTNIPMDLPDSGNTVNYDSLSLWEWSDHRIDPDGIQVHHSTSMVQAWDVASHQDMLSGTRFDVSSSAGFPRSEPAPHLNHIRQRSLCQDDQAFFIPEEFIKDHNHSVVDLVSDLSKDVDCECSSQLGQLMYLISLRRAAPTPLDLILAVEQQLNRTKGTISTCAKCCLSSPYMSMMICTSMSWVVEHLETYIREATAVNAHNHQVPYLTIEGLNLSEEISHMCSATLVKLRLRRVVQIARELSVLNTDVKSTILNGMRSTAAETGAAAQQMFGMLEMRGTF
jgi:hypothetical protein